jgi:hypothetical protein
MISFILRIPVLIVALIWSLFFPARPQPVPAAWPAQPSPDAPSEGSLREGHELSDANPAVIGKWVLGLFAMVFAIIGSVAWLYATLYSGSRAMPVQIREGSYKFAPQSKTGIDKDWDRIAAETRRHLGGYGWTDRAHGLVHIPIERAMALVAGEGLPARAGASPPPFPPPDQEKLPLMETETTSHEMDLAPQ